MLAGRSRRRKYTPDDGDLVRLFYVPALEDAKRYDRLTGYFNAGALAPAARGIEGLVRNRGCMRFVVGCTLPPAEIEAIVTTFRAFIKGEGVIITMIDHGPRFHAPRYRYFAGLWLRKIDSDRARCPGGRPRGSSTRRTIRATDRPGVPIGIPTNPYTQQELPLWGFSSTSTPS